MTHTIREQILVIRAEGATNMFDTQTVQRIAFEKGVFFQGFALREWGTGDAPAGAPKGFPLALWKPSESPFYTAGAREGLPLGTGK